MEAFPARCCVAVREDGEGSIVERATTYARAGCRRGADVQRAPHRRGARAHSEPTKRSRRCVIFSRPGDPARARHALGEVTGGTVDDDVVRHIFAHFCVGK